MSVNVSLHVNNWNLDHMKMLFIIPELSGGGAERVVSVLTTKLAEQHHDVFLLTHKKSNQRSYKISERVKIVFLKFNYPKHLIQRLYELGRRVVKLRRVVHSVSPDFVIASLTGCAMITLLSLFFSRYKVIVCEHNQYFSIKNPIKRICRNLIYIRASKITLLTERDIANYPFFLKEKIIVQENPLSWEPKLLPLKEWNGKLLAVGRIEHQKNFSELIEIIYELTKKTPGFTLDIIGDGTMLPLLKQKVKDLKLTKSIRFLGEKNNMHDIYGEYDLLVMTSHYEGLPMVIAEAFSCCLPVVSYDSPTGPKEMIDDGRNGFIINQYDKDNFRHAIVELSKNEVLYKKMQLEAYNKSKKWSSTNIVDKFKEVLM